MNSVFEKPEIKHPIKTIKSFCTSLKWAWQRAHRGYCEKDVWSIDYWFLGVLPYMLEDLRNNHMGFPLDLEREQYEILGITSFEEYIKLASEEDKAAVRDAASKRWDEILSLMIFLLKEANEDTCSRLNPYEKENHQVWNEFNEKYGFLGEKLLTEEDKQIEKHTHIRPVYFPHHLPEYKDVCDRYMDESISIDEYRERCKTEALELFSKWFYNLWD